MYFSGLFIAFMTFVIIGIFHPVVIKTEYYSGTRWWWLFLLGGLLCVGAALFIENITLSALTGVLGAALLWSVGELFSQRRRVLKGWFPANPRRLHEYPGLQQSQDARQGSREMKPSAEVKAPSRGIPQEFTEAKPQPLETQPREAKQPAEEEVPSPREPQQTEEVPPPPHRT